MMKVSYFIPLIIHSVLVFGFWQMPLLLPGFILSYCLMVWYALEFREPIVNGRDKSPFLIPGAIYAAIVLATTVIFKPMTHAFLFPFACWFFLMVTTYGMGVVIITKDFKNQLGQSRAEHHAKPFDASGKSRKKLLLVNPISHHEMGLVVDKATCFPPLSLGILAALTPRDLFQVELVDEHFEQFQYREADLVALTAFTAYAPRAYEIADVYRKSGIPVVMGGIHASMRTEEALEYVDSVVTGEAEEIWATVLEDFLNHNLQRVYHGTRPELEQMVIPDRSLFDRRYLFATVQTSRGCPNNCKFCSVTAFNGRRYRQRPVEQVLDELETISNRYIFFIDDDLLGHSKASEERAIALFKGMVERRLNKRWLTQTTVKLGTKPEVLKWAARSGCEMVFLGLESVDHEELVQMNKRPNLGIDYPKALKNINRSGIAIIGGFIYGNEDETREKMLQKADFIIRNRVDVMQQSKLTAFPGTEVFKTAMEKKQILYTNYPQDWGKYNFYYATNVLGSMAQAEFVRTFRHCIERTYSYKTIILKALKTLIYARKFQTAVICLRLNLIYRMLSMANVKEQLPLELEQVNAEVLIDGKATLATWKAAR